MRHFRALVNGSVGVVPVAIVLFAVSSGGGSDSDPHPRAPICGGTPLRPGKRDAADLVLKGWCSVDRSVARRRPGRVPPRFLARKRCMLVVGNRDERQARA